MFSNQVQPSTVLCSEERALRYRMFQIIRYNGTSRTHAQAVATK